MPKHLIDLLNANLVRVGEPIHFTFKKHTFSGLITEHGFIHRTRYQSGPLIFGPTCFDSPTKWTNTCLQEHLQEYNTRYSAWRRVRVTNVDKTLEQLYNQLQKKDLLEQRHLRGARLQQLVRLQQIESCELKTRLEDAHQALDQWHDWWRNHSGNTPPPVPEVATTVISNPTETKTEPAEVVETHETPQTAIWYPPGACTYQGVTTLEPRAIAAYAHEFFS